MALLIVMLVISVALNIFLGYYSFTAAKRLMNVSRNISMFWADLIEYKDFLDSLMDMKMYKNNSTIKSFVQYTKKILENIEDFKEVCEISGLLTEEDLQTIQEMEEEFNEQSEQFRQEAVENEHLKEWDRDRVQQKLNKGDFQEGPQGVRRG